MNNPDFVRQASSFNASRRSGSSLWQALHIDPPLLIGVCLLGAFGLFVLNSATGGDQAVIQRQAIVMVVGLIVMCAVAQFNVHFFVAGRRRFTEPGSPCSSWFCLSVLR